jgi:two-component system, LytTR family, response regulator
MNQKIRTLIIEDEAPARRLLQEFIKQFPDLELIGQCTDGFEGAKKIMEAKPDLIFLDIQMPRINGFEMLELLKGEQLPLIIFTTAYDEFAIKSFEFNTCDYLLKPLGKERFEKSVSKALKIIGEGQAKPTDLDNLISQGISKDTYLDRIVIRSGSSINVVYTDNLLCIEASDDYLIIHAKGDQWVKKQTMKFYEEKLDPAEFVRVHRSFIVKLSAIERIEPYSKDAWVAILSSGLKISVSKSGYSHLKKNFNF